MTNTYMAMFLVMQLVLVILTGTTASSGNPRQPTRQRKTNATEINKQLYEVNTCLGATYHGSVWSVVSCSQTVTCFILTVWNCPSPIMAHCHLRPSFISFCDRCDRSSSFDGILTTCNLLDLKQELTETEQLLLANGERLFNIRREPISSLHNFATLSPRGLSHVSLLQYIIEKLEDFIFGLEIIRHNNAIILLNNATHNTAELESRLENHVCAVRSLLRNEKQLFDRDLQIPDCIVNKTQDAWIARTRRHCIDFSHYTFKTAARNLRQILLDLEDLFPNSQL